MALTSHSITHTHGDARLQVLLQELVDQDKIEAGTKRKTVYPLVKDDERYTKVLGSPGADPLELFWDVMDIMDQKPEGKIEIGEGDTTRNINCKSRRTRDDTPSRNSKCLDCRRSTRMQHTPQSVTSAPPKPTWRSWSCSITSTTALA